MPVLEFSTEEIEDLPENFICLDCGSELVEENTGDEYNPALLIYCPICN